MSACRMVSNQKATDGEYKRKERGCGGILHLRVFKTATINNDLDHTAKLCAARVRTVTTYMDP